MPQVDALMWLKALRSITAMSLKDGHIRPSTEGCNGLLDSSNQSNEESCYKVKVAGIQSYALICASIRVLDAHIPILLV